MAIAIPTLTPNKFIYDPNIILERIYLYYVTGNYEQTKSFFGDVRTLLEAFNKSNYKADEVKKVVEEDLYFITRNYFQAAEINVDINKKKDLVGNNKVLYEIGIDIEVTDEDGNKYSLSRTLESVNFKSVVFNNNLDFIFKEMYENN